MVILAMFIASMDEHGDFEKKKHVETRNVFRLLGIVGLRTNRYVVVISYICDDGLWPVKKGVAHQRKQRLTTNIYI